MTGTLAARVPLLSCSESALEDGCISSKCDRPPNQSRSTLSSGKNIANSSEQEHLQVKVEYLKKSNLVLELLEQQTAQIVLGKEAYIKVFN
jgi:hypothetical protein